MQGTLLFCLRLGFPNGLFPLGFRTELLFVHFLFSIHATIKVQLRPRIGCEGPEGEQMYSCTLSLTIALDEGGCLTPWRQLYPQERDPVLRVEEARVGPKAGLEGEENLTPAVFDPRTVQTIPNRFTD